MNKLLTLLYRILKLQAIKGLNMTASIWNPGVASAGLTFPGLLMQNGSPLGTTLAQNVALQVDPNLLSLRGKFTSTAVGTLGSISLVQSVITFFFPANMLLLPCGTFVFQRLSGTRYEGSVVVASTTAFNLVVTGASGYVSLGQDPAFAIAIGDVLYFSALVPLV